MRSIRKASLTIQMTPIMLASSEAFVIRVGGGQPEDLVCLRARSDGHGPRRSKRPRMSGQRCKGRPRSSRRRRTGILLNWVRSGGWRASRGRRASRRPVRASVRRNLRPITRQHDAEGVDDSKTPTHRDRFAVIDEALGVAPCPDEQAVVDLHHLQRIEDDDGHGRERLDEDDCQADEVRNGWGRSRGTRSRTV